MALIEEELTEQFIRWEVRGRGWDLWDAPVSPEPAYMPFRGYSLPSDDELDDGLKLTAISAFLRNLKARFFDKSTETEKAAAIEPRPRLFEPKDMFEMQISIPPKYGLNERSFLNFLVGLSGCSAPITFEIIAAADKISCGLVVSRNDLTLVYAQLAAITEDVRIFRRGDYLEDLWGEYEGRREAVVECRLAREFMVPLRSAGNGDPLLPLIGALSEVGEGETAVFQVIMEAVRHPWAESILRSVNDGMEKPFFTNADHLYQGAKQKVVSPLYAAVLRVAAKSPLDGRAAVIADNLLATLRVFSDQAGNEFVAIGEHESTPGLLRNDLLRRQSHRSGMILNAEELVSLVHLPADEIKSPNLRSAAALSPGQGGKPHRYLQQFIKQWAEGMGWRATVERQLLGGGSVDVVLSREAVSIACEIARSTSIDHEIGNVKKCLAAEFTWIVLVIPEERRLAPLKAQTLDTLSPEEAARVRFLSAVELQKFVEEQQPKPTQTTTTAKGYKAKVNYRPLNSEEAENKIKLVIKMVAERLR